MCIIVYAAPIFLHVINNNKHTSGFKEDIYFCDEWNVYADYLRDVAYGKHDAYHGQYLDDASLLVRHQERLSPRVAGLPQF